MTEPTDTEPDTRYRWAVIIATLIALVAFMANLGGPQLWPVIPAMAAVGIAIFASIRNPELRTSANVAAVIAAVAGGISVFFA